MNQDILSLKSLYQFLVVNDFPIYSTGIISKDKHTGLTLTKFWTENLIVDFRSGLCGKKIWRTEGGRNRYLSEVCNRSKRFHSYGEYMEEVGKAVNREMMLLQIRQFTGFLLQRQYDYKVFCKKLQGMLEMLAESDPYFTQEALIFFKTARKLEDYFDGRGAMGRSYYCGWMFTFLMFHALSGNGEGENILRVLRGNKEFSLKALEGDFCLQKNGSRKEVEWLTGRNTELCGVALPARHFFGREEELFELREMLLQGGKYLISGMGGMGKTELMRQLIRICEEEQLVDYICTIQFRGSLAESFAHAFPNITGEKTFQIMQEAVARLCMRKQDKGLVIIDNLNQMQLEQEEIQALQRIPATIFITSRCREFPGLQVYSLRNISVATGSLIFRDNYKGILSAQDKSILEEVLHSDGWCHALTMRLLGRTMGRGHMTMKELKQHLMAERNVVLSGEGGNYESLKKIYRRMYARFERQPGMDIFLEMFALLPYREYSVEFLETFLGGFLPDNVDLKDCLKQLHMGGWLDLQGERYSIHPLVAETFMKQELKEEQLQPYLDALASALKLKGNLDENFSNIMIEGNYFLAEPVSDAIRGLMYFCGKIKVEWTKELCYLVLLSRWYESHLRGVDKSFMPNMQIVEKQSHKLSAAALVYLGISMLVNGHEDYKDIEERFLKKEILEEIKEPLRSEALAIYDALMVGRGMYEEAGQLAEELLQKEQPRKIKLILYQSMAIMANRNMDWDQFREWSLKGYQLGKSNKPEDILFWLPFLMFLVGYYSTVGRYDEAEKYLEEYKNNLGEHIVFKKGYYHHFGMLKMQRGDEGYGVEELEKCIQIIECAGEAKEEYILVKGILAIAYNKAGLREQSEATYKECLEYYRREPEDKRGMLYNTLNNMSVMYLDWKKPGDALECLMEMEEEFMQAQGPLIIAEWSNNLSKAWRMLGQRETELGYLKKAVPIMEQYYPAEHPKLVDAKKRLEEG